MTARREGVRLGDVLVRWGVLTNDERERVVDAQRLSARPFGALAEEMFGVDPRRVEDAWAEQLSQISAWTDPGLEAIDQDVLAMVDRRQAWQFRLVPVRLEGEEVVCVTPPTELARAMRFVGWRLSRPCRFEFCTSDQLDRALSANYPLGGGLGMPSPAGKGRCVVQDVSPLQLRR